MTAEAQHSIVAGRRYLPVCTGNRFHVDGLILAEVSRRRPERVLDVGCANGRFARELPASFVVGIEIDEQLALAARRVCHHVILGDVECPETVEAAARQAPYDLVLALDIIEHLARPELALARLAALLGAQGRVIISVPNLVYYRERLRLLLGRFETTPCGGLYDATHLRYFSRRELERLLQQAGLVTERLIGAGNVRPGRRIAAWPAPLRAAHRAVSFGVHRAAQARPQLFARSFVVVARRAEERQ